MAEEAQEQSYVLNEISVLGIILLDNSGESFLIASQRVTPDDFSDSRNKTLFASFVSLNRKGININLATVEEELKNQKQFEAIGGEEYLNTILEKAVTQGSIDNYLAAVKDKAVFDRFINMLQNTVDEAKKTPINDISEFIGSRTDKILEISQQRRITEAKSLRDVSDNLVAKLVKQTKDFREKNIPFSGITGVRTGYEQLDELTKGWHPGDMIVVGARPSVGKTAFALNLLYNVAKQNKPVVFFSLEMTAESIAMRLLNLTSGLSSDRINQFDYQEQSTKENLLIDTHGDPDTAADVVKLQRGLNELVNLPFYIDDNPGSKMMDISTKCKQLQNSILQKDKQNIALIAIDYIGLITSPSKANAGSRQQEVSDISRQLKQMARQLSVPVIALTQLSRESEKRPDHRPQMSDIRDSGSIEQDADMIFMLYRPDYYETQKNYGAGESEEDQQEASQNNPISQVAVSLMKNRNGSTGALKFMFDKEHCQFNILDTDHDEDQG